jgi:hypothetical protein
MEYWCVVINNCWLGWCGNSIKIQNIMVINNSGISSFRSTIYASIFAMM